MFIIKNKNIFLGISALLMTVSIVLISIFGFNMSVEFKGGTLLEVEYVDTKPNIVRVNQSLDETELGSFTVQETGELGIIVKTSELSDEDVPTVKEALTINSEYDFVEKRLQTIGPSISSELKSKSIFAIIFVSIVIVAFIAYVFRHVSMPVSSFKYGLVSIVALIHDILIPTAVFSVIGSFYLDYQIDVLFITALLAILGFSVNDTIVVFDRIRENLRNHKNKNPKGQIFESIVGKSLNETFRRSINTSITTLVVLIVLFIVGDPVTKPFSLVLAIGVIAGTYSSLFLASPLLVFIEKHQKEISEKDKKDKALTRPEKYNI